MQLHELTKQGAKRFWEPRSAHGVFESHQKQWLTTLIQLFFHPTQALTIFATCRQLVSHLGIHEFIGSVNATFRGWSSGGSLHTGEVAVAPTRQVDEFQAQLLLDGPADCC